VKEALANSEQVPAQVEQLCRMEARKAGHNHLLGGIQLILECFDRHELLINDVIQDDVHQEGRPFPDTLDFVLHNTFYPAEGVVSPSHLRR